MLSLDGALSFIDETFWQAALAGVLLYIRYLEQMYNASDGEVQNLAV